MQDSIQDSIQLYAKGLIIVSSYAAENILDIILRSETDQRRALQYTNITCSMYT